MQPAAQTHATFKERGSLTMTRGFTGDFQLLCPFRFLPATRDRTLVSKPLAMPMVRCNTFISHVHRFTFSSCRRGSLLSPNSWLSLSGGGLLSSNGPVVLMTSASEKSKNGYDAQGTAMGSSEVKFFSTTNSPCCLHRKKWSLLCLGQRDLTRSQGFALRKIKDGGLGCEEHFAQSEQDQRHFIATVREP